MPNINWKLVTIILLIIFSWFDHGDFAESNTVPRPWIYRASRGSPILEQILDNYHLSTHSMDINLYPLLISWSG